MWRVFPKVLRQPATMWVLLVWTVGVIAVWLVADWVLNPGVSEEDVQECAAEGFIPPTECRETLEALQATQEPVLGIGVTVGVWVAGVVLLLWVMSRPRPAP
jgi:hypothetical protein